jgi:hypothetical protein
VYFLLVKVLVLKTPGFPTAIRPRLTNIIGLQLPTVTNSQQLPRKATLDSDQHLPIPTITISYPQLPTATNSYQQLPTATNSYQ